MKHFSDLSSTAERVLDAAESLLQQRGYNGFSYEDIAQQVGIKKPSIHHHFPKKEQLVATLTQRYSHRFQAQLTKIEEKHSKAPNQLSAYASLFEATFIQERRLCVCGMLGAEVDSLPTIVSDEIHQFFKLNLDWLTHIITGGQKEKLLTAQLSPTQMAELFLCILEGSMVVGRGVPTIQTPKQMGANFLLTILI